MNSTNRFFGLLLVVSSFFLFSMYLPIPIQEVRGLYVDDFQNIIGQPEKEITLLKYAEQEGFNYLLLDNLHDISKHLYDLTNMQESQALAQFIKKAKTEFGILEMGAIGETAQSFEVIHQYNELYHGSLFFGIDVYNMEFEFWNNQQVANYYCPTFLQQKAIVCNEKGVFDFYLSELKKVRDMAHASNLKCETYIGKPTLKQCEAIGQVCDRVLVHYYRASDVYKNGNSIYQFQDYRLPALAPKEGVLQILPIFSAKKDHMGTWLQDHSKKQAYETFYHGQNGFQEMTGKWKEHIHIQGAQWHGYSDLAF